MKNIVLSIVSLSLLLGACGPVNQPRQQSPAHLSAAQAHTAGLKEAAVVERQVQVPRSDFDQVADQSKSKIYAPDSLFKQTSSDLNSRSSYGSPFGSLPFENWSDFREYIKSGSPNADEDNKYMYDYHAQNHFNRYLNTAFREVQRLYKASPEEMKRFIVLDVLANSLEVDGRPLPYVDVHNPPAERHYKFFPTEAARLMPTFGEISNYNRTSYDVNYVRWDDYRAALYYQSNYARIYGMIMQYGPTKQEAWRLVHREVSTYAAR